MNLTMVVAREQPTVIRAGVQGALTAAEDTNPRVPTPMNQNVSLNLSPISAPGCEPFFASRPDSHSHDHAVRCAEYRLNGHC